MASTQIPDPSDGAAYWAWRYESGNSQWHLKDLSRLLVTHHNKLNLGGKVKSVLYPMCGMSLDLTWFADEQGLDVAGIDFAMPALKSVMDKSGHEWTESPAPTLGPDGKAFTRKDGKMKLYCGDVLNFTSEFGGHFDAVFDRDGLHTVAEDQRPRYAAMIKDVLNPGGKLLLEAIYYDPAILEDETFKPTLKVPPPYSMTIAQVKSLFEPEYTVEHIDTHTDNLLYGRKTDFNDFVIARK